jgi:branched-chain amino acid transport system ATP-binding protein
MLLKVEKLVVAYGKIVALKEISLFLSTGEMVAIIGANGAGKTTLINAISGVVPLQRGSVFFQDKIISGWPAWKIARQGIVQIPEGRKIFPKLTVVENLELGAHCEKKAGVVKSLIEEMFNHFPILKERRHQAGGTLSGGEQQMLAIARGLMARPKLLLFDEPSMGLAPIMVEKVFQIIQDINQRGISVLLVEQNAKKSLQIAQRAYLFETGKIILTGAGKELLEKEEIKKAYLGK